jgi:hypothetical protein
VRGDFRPDPLHRPRGRRELRVRVEDGCLGAVALLEVQEAGGAAVVEDE